MDWVGAAVARAQAKLQSLADSAPTYSMPMRTCPDDAPGWSMVEERYSAIPDVAYPPDPAVLRALRAFCPDVTYFAIYSTWRSSKDDGPRKHMTLMRHGVARRVEDPRHEVHDFYCEMPATPVPGFPTLYQPNYVELNHYDRHDRPWGYDLPGAYLPFDWYLYYDLYESYFNGEIQASRDLKDATLTPHLAKLEREKASRADEAAYKERDLARYRQRIFEAASEIEMRDYLLGDHTPARKPMIELRGRT